MDPLSFVELNPNLEKMEDLKCRMWLLSLFDYSLELLSGDWAKSLCWIAGKKLGNTVDVEKVGSVEEAVKLMDPWKIEVLEKVSENEYLVVFRECPIRQTHYTVCTQQGGTLCQVTHGFFTQVMANALGKNVKLELIHAGPNACLKRVVIE